MKKHELIEKMMREDAVALQPPQPCEVFYIRDGEDIAWEWRAGKTSSRRVFKFFFDCVEDARKRGFSVSLEAAPREADASRARTRSLDQS